MAAASWMDPTVEFMDPKYTLAEGRGLVSWSCRGTIHLGRRSPEIIRGHVVQGTNLGYKQTCDCWTWALFAAATRWLQWLHLHIYLVTEIDAQINIKPTHAPLMGEQVARRCFAHSVAWQLQKIKHV